MSAIPPDNPEFSARILTSINQVNSKAWDALIPAGQHPFLTHAFLKACEDSGSAVPDTGWTPVHIWLEDASGTAVGAAPLYVKTHSQGEYVFDHSWADAMERAGGQYYPKLQSCVPFTPATGPRLLANSAEARSALLAGMAQFCAAQGFSGAHVTFLTEEDRAVCDAAGWLHREDRQFHFINRGYNSFDDFLGSLASRKRKNIRKERAAAQDGVTISRLTGADLKPHHWDIFYRCYIDTSQRKWGRPYLTRAFFEQIHDTLADQIILVIAERDGAPIAAALNFIGSDALYGRNWGALEHKPFLHFELCYYQAIEAGIERGLPKVEAGAQGEHKLARGYEPVATHSAHHLAHPGLHKAVGDYLEHERLAVERDIHYLGKHTPFKKAPPPKPATPKIPLPKTPLPKAPSSEES